MKVPVAIAWLLAAVTILTTVPDAVLLAIPVRPGAANAAVAPIQVLSDAVFLVVAPVMGLLIVRRHPENAVGWLFIALAFLLSMGFLGDGVARHVALSGPGSWFLLVTSALSDGAFLILFLLLALFPTGQLISRRWALLPVAGTATLASLIGAEVFTVPLNEEIPDVPNPVFGGGVGNAEVAAVLNDLASIGVVVALALAVAHLVVRFRRSNGVERQQLKWFGLAATLIGALLTVAAAAEFVGPAPGSTLRLVGDVAWAATFSCFGLLPIAAAIAMLRYRLYDVDRLISRTFAYALVTGVLGATFLAIVVVAQAAFAPVTQSNHVAVAASTLVVASLFQPLRRRVQVAVDRRFNRRRYDAELELEAFVSRVRDEVEVERVSEALAAILDRTIQPATMAVWLRRSAA